MSKVFIVDIAKCTGCYNCQLVCKDEHCGNDWTPYAKAQPMTGHFWAKLNQKTVGTMPKVKINYTPTFCNHCENAPCLAAAKDGAVYRREDGLIIIDPEKAVGQKELVASCPYGAIYWNEELNLAQKCTGCAHLLDNGYAQPRCSEICPTGALIFGDEEELQDQIIGADVMNPEFGLGPRVYYRNIPGQFIAGTVYDPVEKEVIIGAKVRCLQGGKLMKCTTDEYGDFWFKDLSVGVHEVHIEAPGYKTVSFTGLKTTECINLGDIPMEKE